jgi:hypothetical protein
LIRGAGLTITVFLIMGLYANIRKWLRDY